MAQKESPRRCRLCGPPVPVSLLDAVPVGGESAARPRPWLGSWARAFLSVPASCAGFCDTVNSNPVTLPKRPVLRAAQVAAIFAPVPSLLTQTRKSRGLSLDQVAASVGTDPTNLSRVEKGAQVPKRELARALFRFYDGRVPLGAIYDPEFDPEQQAA